MDNVKMAVIGTQFSDGTVSLAWATGRGASEVIAVPPANRSSKLRDAINAGVVVETASAVTTVTPTTAPVRKSVYVQSTDPGAVGAGQLWSDTSGNPPVLKIRNTANGAWLTV
jgi:hypothetical protein